MKKEPFVTKAQLDEIIKTYPTPFHLYDEKGMRENMKALKEAFSWNKGYREYPCFPIILFFFIKFSAKIKMFSYLYDENYCRGKSDIFQGVGAKNIFLCM